MTVIDRTYQVQLANQARRTDKRKEKRRKDKVKLAAEEAAEGGQIRYNGDVDKCVICFDLLRVNR